MKNQKTKINQWIISLIIATMPAMSAFAEKDGGSGVGNGGDPNCQEFYGLMSDISIQLAKIGQVNVNAINPLINVDASRNVFKNGLKVIPGDKLDRTAISNSTTLITLLDLSQWRKILNSYQKVALAAHELMVLTNAESDGEYGVSKDLMKLMISSQYIEQVGILERIKSYRKNANGSYTVKPLEYISAKSSKKGVCKYLGFKDNASNFLINRFELFTHNQFSMLVIDSQGLVSSDDSGHITFLSAIDQLSEMPDPETRVFKNVTEITCIH